MVVVAVVALVVVVVVRGKSGSEVHGGAVANDESPEEADPAEDAADTGGDSRTQVAVSELKTNHFTDSSYGTGATDGAEVP